MKIKSIVISGRILLGVLVIDFVAAIIADRIVVNNDYYFSKSIQEINLDFEGDWRQGCDINSVLAVYKFKTCFVMRNTNSDGRIFFFKYAKPVSFFFGGADDNRRAFKDISITESVKIIYPNGKVEDL